MKEDIRNLDLESGSFVTVLLAQVLEHFPKDEGYHLLKLTVDELEELGYRMRGAAASKR